MREAGASFCTAALVPEVGGVGYMLGTGRELRLGMLGAAAGMSLRLRLCVSLGGESAVVECGSKTS